MTKTKLALIFPLFLIYSISLAQECSCTIKEVEANTVLPCDLIVGEVVEVSTTAELRSAIITANQNGGNTTILIADGIYPIASTSWYPYITASNIVFRSASGNRDAVVLSGTGMAPQSDGTEIGIFAVGDHITIADLTIRDVANHGISVSGENLYVHNVKIQNTYEQMIKGVSSEGGADHAIIQCSLFEYTAGVGPQFYIGGLDIHDGDGCVVSDNIFKNIASPSGSLAEHAIHFWNNSSGNIIERNQIINCDRGIGFGLGSSANEGGIIRNNMIYNDGHHDYDDVGIGLETSPNTKVYNNTIHIDYPNAIEYRFEATNNVEIINNITNKIIRSRNGGQAEVSNNLETTNDDWFLNLSGGDLRMVDAIPELIEMGKDLSEEVLYDIDKNLRSSDGLHDLGAHEYISISTDVSDRVNSQSLVIYPNPSAHELILQSDQFHLSTIKIWSVDQRLVYTAKNQSLKEQLKIQVDKWESGMYYVKVYNGNRYTSVKMFIKL